MIEVKNVSKYYTTENTVSVGIKNVTTSFRLGEFVAITGESGSGKSTFLNCLGGIDTYEEGEIIAFNEDTSGFSKEEWENYRKKYNSFIFQDYNILPSYSVAENIEMALLTTCPDKHEREKRINELIDKVGLTNQKNQKAVTLSGGQKQRMVIARALAVNSPVILADEPTGNLDAESGKEIMELLYSFRRDRLIIVVTHNYEQIEPYATRKLRFHDGELVEDIVLKPIETESNADEKIAEVNTNKDQKNETKACLRATVLSLKNTPKRTVFMTILFVLASFVFLLIVASNTSSYTDDYTNNNTFPNNDINRLVVKNENNSLFTQADFDKIESINNYGGMVKYDFLTDIAFFYVPENQYDYLRFYVKPLSVYNEKSVIYGSLPENNNEIFLSVSADRQDEFNELLNKTIEFKCNSDNYFTQEESEKFSFKLTGFIVNKNTSDKCNILVNDEQIKELGVNLFFTYFPQRAEILGVSMSGGIKPVSYDVAIDNNVSDGKATLVVNSMHEGNLDFPFDEAFIDKAVEITVNIVFDNLTTTVSIDEIKTEKFNINYFEDGELDIGKLYISYNDALALMENIYQISVFTKDNVEKFQNELWDNNYSAIRVYFESEYDDLLRLIFIVNLVSIIISGLVIYIIIYFVTKKTIMSSKNDYSIMRSVGFSKREIKKVIFLNAIFIALTAYLVASIMALMLLTFMPKIFGVFTSLTILSRLLVLVAIMIIDIMATIKCTKELFNNSVKKSLTTDKVR